MRAHYLQHVPFEGLGAIQTWLDQKAAQVTSTRFFNDEALPNLDNIELLVVLGGPMSVNDEGQLPWLKQEKQFILEAITRGKAVLGICLGAQLIANSLGKPVYRNQEKEIGWLPITGVKTEAADSAPTLELPKQFTALHWHGETFDLPDGAKLLASTEACKNQAFSVNNRVLGLQFHLEATEESVEEMITNCCHELTPGCFIQSAAEIRAGLKTSAGASQALLYNILNYLTDSRSLC